MKTEYVVKKTEQFYGIPHSYLEDGEEPWEDGHSREFYEIDEYEIMSGDEYSKYLDKYCSEVCGKWKEITEERYYKMLEILPPLHWKQDGFFISEPYTLNIHDFFQKHQEGKYYEAMFRINTPRSEILASLDDFVKKQ